MNEQQKKMRDGFLEAIRLSPEDPLNHYAYADWLEEHGFNDDEAKIHREWTLKKYQEANEFMEVFAMEAEESVDFIMKSAMGKVESKENYYDVELSLHYTPQFLIDNNDKFWECFMTLTGIPVPAEKIKETFFSGCCGVEDYD